VAQIGPIKRKDLVANLRRLGFEGPFSGGKHEFMKGLGRKIRLPNPHQGDISEGLLRRILRDSGIQDQWAAL
jgi:predicted RNA binding protein YcfA (HicA-like mRNA interferase family)